MTGTTDTDTITIRTAIHPDEWRKSRGEPFYHVDIAMIPLVGDYAASVSAHYRGGRGDRVLTLRMDRLRVQYRDGYCITIASPFSDPREIAEVSPLDRWSAKRATFAVRSALTLEIGERFARIAAEWRDSLRAQEAAAAE